MSARSLCTRWTCVRASSNGPATMARTALCMAAESEDMEGGLRSVESVGMSVSIDGEASLVSQSL